MLAVAAGYSVVAIVAVGGSIACCSGCSCCGNCNCSRQGLWSHSRCSQQPGESDAGRQAAGGLVFPVSSLVQLLLPSSLCRAHTLLGIWVPPCTQSELQSCMPLPICLPDMLKASVCGQAQTELS